MGFHANRRAQSMHLVRGLGASDGYKPANETCRKNPEMGLQEEPNGPLNKNPFRNPNALQRAVAASSRGVGSRYHILRKPCGPSSMRHG